MINLGLNRKISNVLSKNLNDPESDIYKEIISIASETTESDSSVNTVIKIIEDGKNQITRFYDDTLDHVSSDFFNDFDNLEEIYLLKAYNVGDFTKLAFLVNCPKLKKLMLPKYSIGSIVLDTRIAALPIEIMLLPGNIPNGGMFLSDYPTFSSLKTLVLKNCSSIGHSGLDSRDFPNLNNLILLNKESCVHRDGNRDISFLNVYNNIYVPDTMVDIYISNGLAESRVKTLNQLPNNLKKELELCQIQI